MPSIIQILFLGALPFIGFAVFWSSWIQEFINLHLPKWTVKGGANHGDNMHYESFPDEIMSISDAQREVSGKYHAYVTSFITSRDPNSTKGRWSDREAWEKHNKESERVMTFGMENDERAGGSEADVAAEMRGSESAKKECNFWWRKSHDTEE